MIGRQRERRDAAVKLDSAAAGKQAYVTERIAAQIRPRHAHQPSICRCADDDIPRRNIPQNAGVDIKRSTAPGDANGAAGGVRRDGDRAGGLGGEVGEG